MTCHVADDVHVEDPAPDLGSCRIDVGVRDLSGGPCVVDQDVEPAVPLLDVGEQPVDLLGVGDVRSVVGGRGEAPCERLAGIDTRDGIDHQHGPGFGEPPDGGRADTGSRAGHQYDLSFEGRRAVGVGRLARIGHGGESTGDARLGSASCGWRASSTGWHGPGS